MPNLFSEKQSYEAIDILHEAVDLYKPKAIFALFSGGHDSLCAAHVASTLPTFNGCFHANTTIGIERTRQYVRDTCKEQGWPLVELYPPENYQAYVEQFGFPGPAMHSMVYSLLKERCVRELVRRYKTARLDNIMLVSGIRQQESRRRMGYDDAISKVDSQIWVSPLFYWSKQMRDDYIAEHGLPRNPIADALGMSGECLCGAFAGSKKGGTPEAELARIGAVDPAVPIEIARLESIARAAGKPCRWGYPPPVEQERSQCELLELQGQTYMPLCSSCMFNKEAQ